MIELIKRFIAVGFLCSGLLILGDMLLGRVQLERPAQPALAQYTYLSLEKVRSEFVFNADSLFRKGARIAALFVTDTRACEPCLYELWEYGQLMRDVDSVASVTSQLIILDPNSQSAVQFATVADLDLPYGHGYPEELVSLLTSYNDRTYQRQIVFVDVETNIAFFRIVLPTSVITRISDKKDAIRSMLHEWEMHKINLNGG